MLLEREDVNPNQGDTEYGRTPLSWAAEKGHEGVVKVLLGRGDVRTITPDNWGQTPLPLALSQGHHGVVRILQQRMSIPTQQIVMAIYYSSRLLVFLICGRYTPSRL